MLLKKYLLLGLLVLGLVANLALACGDDDDRGNGTNARRRGRANEPNRLDENAAASGTADSVTDRSSRRGRGRGRGRRNGRRGSW